MQAMQLTLPDSHDINYRQWTVTCQIGGQHKAHVHSPWDERSDIDLYLTTPGKRRIGKGKRQSRGGRNTIQCAADDGPILKFFWGQIPKKLNISTTNISNRKIGGWGIWDCKEQEKGARQTQ